MRTRTFGAAAIAGALLVFVVGLLSHPHADRDGQLIFTRWAALAPDSADASLGRITIDSCADTDGGLEVRGRLPAAPGVTPVLVTAGRPTDPGVAVSSSFAARSALLPGAGTGGFLLVLPWGSAQSRFAVAAPDSLTGDPAEVRHGAVARCP